MKTYEVVIESIERKVILVQADSADEAQDAAWDQWDGGTDGDAEVNVVSSNEVRA